MLVFFDIQRWLCDMERHGNRMLQEFTFSYIPLDEEIIHTSKLNDKIQNNPTKHSLNGQILGLIMFQLIYKKQCIQNG